MLDREQREAIIAHLLRYVRDGEKVELVLVFVDLALNRYSMALASGVESWSTKKSRLAVAKEIEDLAYALELFCERALNLSTAARIEATREIDMRRPNGLAIALALFAQQRQQQESPAAGETKDRRSAVSSFFSMAQECHEILVKRAREVRERPPLDHRPPQMADRRVTEELKDIWEEFTGERAKLHNAAPEGGPFASFANAAACFVNPRYRARGWLR